MERPGFEEVLFTLRAMRRLRPDPVAEADLRFIVEAATQAASSHNSQTWAFVVVTDREQRRRIADAYRAIAERTIRPGAPATTGLDAGDQKIWTNAWEFSQRLHEVPALVICCLHGAPTDSPLWRSAFYGSIYPAIQNLMLAARYRGLGTVLTTLHLADEAAFKKILEIPDDVSTVAMIPVGHPAGAWRRPLRRPADAVTHWNRWNPRP